MMSALFQMITIIEVWNEGTFIQVLNFFDIKKFDYTFLLLKIVLKKIEEKKSLRIFEKIPCNFKDSNLL